LVSLGLFYIVRLFIYQTEGLARPANEARIFSSHNLTYASRLWYIIYLAIGYLNFDFWHLGTHLSLGLFIELGFMTGQSLGFVGASICTHLFAHYLFKNLQSEETRWTSTPV